MDASSDATRFFCKHISRFVSAHGRNALAFLLASHRSRAEIKVSCVTSNFAGSESRASSPRDNTSQTVALTREGQIKVSPVAGRRNASAFVRFAEERRDRDDSLREARPCGGGLP